MQLEQTDTELLPQKPRSAGFTLIEIIIVIALVGMIYTVALPQFGMTSQSEINTKLGAIMADIRSAYDTAVLTHRPHRIVFSFKDSSYWLEVADQDQVWLGDEKLARDPSELDEKDEQEKFDQEFEQFQELAGKDIEDGENDRTIKATSPLIKAKEKLQPVKWTAVNSQEWSVRKLAPALEIVALQAEHHAEKQTFDSAGEDGRAMIYFFPHGYVERAALYLSRKKRGDSDTEAPYAIITNPYEGTADLDVATTDVNVNNEDQDNL